MVDIVARVNDLTAWHGGERTLFVHAAQHFVAKIGAFGLHSVHRAFRQMQRHRPVVTHRAHHVCETGMQGRLRAPRVRRYKRNVLRQAFADRGHQLRHLLVCAVVAQFAKAFAVHRLPHKFVEKAEFLAQTRAEGIKLVLLLHDFRAGALGKAQQIKPVGRVAHAGRGAGDCHRNAIMPKAHANVAHHNGVFGQRLCLRTRHKVFTSE